MITLVFKATPFKPVQTIHNWMFTQLLPSQKSASFNHEFATYAKTPHLAGSGGNVTIGEKKI